MTVAEQRALLMEFAKWCADHGYLDSSFGGVDAFLASLPEPLPACPVCGAVCGDWECHHGAKDEPSDPYCVHGHLTTQDQCPRCADMLATPSAPQQFWRAVRLVPGECWQVEFVDASGRPYKRGTCYYERDYRMAMIAYDMARVDGKASGLPEFEGGERSWGSRTTP